MQSFHFCYIGNIVRLNFSCEMSTRTINTNHHLACKKHLSAEDVDPRYTERLKINQEQVCYLLKRQSTDDSTSNGRSTQRAVRCFNSIYKCSSSLIWSFHCEDWAKERRAMVLSFHMSNNESSAYRSGTQVGHR